MHNVCSMTQITELKKNSVVLGLIRNWTPRQLTLLGMIMIIESLLISKITHILLYVPNSTQQNLDIIDGI